MLAITIDNREPQEIITYLKRRHKGKIEFSTAQLETGDFVSEHCIVERKKIADLYSSIMDGRFKNQCCKMSMLTDKHIIIVVHGNLDEYIKEMRFKRKMNLNKKLVTSALGEAQCQYNMMIIWVEDEHCMLDTMISEIESIEEGNWQRPARCKPEQLWARLLGINIKQLNELQTVCKTKSPIGIAKCSKTTLMSVKGIGEVKAKYILGVLNGK